MKNGAIRCLLLAVSAAVVVAACQGGPSFPIIPSAGLVEKGKPLYQTHCLSCHGDEQGRGRIAQAPPHNSDGHTWHHPDRLLYQWVLDGPPLRTIMPSFRGTLKEDDVVAILAYIKSTWTEEIRQQQILGSREYEEQVKRYGQ